MASTDRTALVAFFRSTGGGGGGGEGGGWIDRTNWDTDADLSQWFGVKVNGEGRVVELSLSANNLQGANT
ncbi:unnamed protein product, partial [Hapterophycus canaliculatus]